MKRVIRWILLLLAGAGLTLWLGPRPVYELWVAETLTKARMEALGIGGALKFSECVPGPPYALAASNGIPARNLPHFDWNQLADVDNDGDLDRVWAWCPCNYGREGPQLCIFGLGLNDGSGRFRGTGNLIGEVFTAPRPVRSFFCADLDRDGRVDILMALADGSFAVLWNHLEKRHFLRIGLRPAADSLARGDTETRVEISVGGKKQVRIVKVDRGGPSPLKGTVHFGLGQQTRVDRAAVLWPSGRVSELSELEVDREIEIVEGEDR